MAFVLQPVTTPKLCLTGGVLAAGAGPTFVCLGGGSSATEAEVAFPLPTDYRLTKFKLTHDAGAATFSVAVRLDGADVAAFTQAGITGSGEVSLAGSVAALEGQNVAVRVTRTAGAVAGDFTFCLYGEEA